MQAAVGSSCPCWTWPFKLPTWLNLPCSCIWAGCWAASKMYKRFQKRFFVAYYHSCRYHLPYWLHLPTSLKPLFDRRTAFTDVYRQGEYEAYPGPIGVLPWSRLSFWSRLPYPLMIRCRRIKKTPCHALHPDESLHGSAVFNIRIQ